MTKDIRNLPASVRARLLNVARNRGEELELVLVHYGIERLLYRLSQSQYSQRFVLKGAMLFVAWGIDDHRPTRDVDFLGSVPADPDELSRIFHDLCVVAVTPDGITFHPESVRAEYIREESEYGGIRVTLTGDIARARVPLQIDVGVGDIVTPGPESIQYPTMLEDFPAPRLDAYPAYTVIAEKLEAAVHLGMANSRMKDFYDLRLFAGRTDLDDALVGKAVRATFQRRKTDLPKERPLAFSSEFADDSIKQRQWAAFLKKNRLDDPNESSLPNTIATIWEAFGRHVLKATDG